MWHMGKNEGYLFYRNSFTKEEVALLTQNNKTKLCYQTISTFRSNIYGDCVLFRVGFDLLIISSRLLSQHTQSILGQGHGQVHNSRLKLCI